MVMQAPTISEAATKLRLRGLVAMAHVADVARSIEFYQQLGFEVGNTVAAEGKLNWAWLKSPDGRAQLMLARSGRPMNPGAQDVLFYLYVDDVQAYRNQLLGRGLAAGEVRFPFWSPRGEFRLDDPDGYALFIAHAD